MNKYSNMQIFSSEDWYSYSICGNIESWILFEYLNILVQIFPNNGLKKSLEILELKVFFFFLTWKIYFDIMIKNYNNIMFVCKLFKHRASTQNTTFYVISENFAFLHYKLFEYFELFKYYSNIFYSTNIICYSIWTIWLRWIIFNIWFGPK